jgi:hypothetical protein
LQVNGWNENIILSEVSQAQEVKAVCFLLYVEYRPNTNTAILHTHINIYRTVPKEGQIEETKGRGKERKKMVNNYKVCHICVGTRCNKTH